VTTKALLVGAGAGFAFGFLDNCFMFMGMSSMDSLFRRLPYAEDDRMLAGYGNAVSSTISAFASSFVGKLINEETGLNSRDAPLWAMSVGLLLGSLLGMYVPRVILGAKK
jgi:hypothetical protein